MERLAYTPEEAVRVSGVSRSRLYEAMRDGRLKARKNGRSTLILAEDLAEFLRALPERQPSKPAA